MIADDEKRVKEEGSLSCFETHWCYKCSCIKACFEPDSEEEKAAKELSVAKADAEAAGIDPNLATMKEGKVVVRDQRKWNRMCWCD